MSEIRANKIQVCVRLRPLNEREKEKETTPIVSASSVHKTVTVVRGRGKTGIRHGACYLCFKTKHTTDIAFGSWRIG